jgi:acyl-CoA thioester hydrolase
VFKFYLRVRYGECDAQRVVYNARYGDYVDIAVNEFLRAAALEDQLINGPYDFQLVKQTLEWKSPARFDQVLEISVRAGHLGNTSFTLAAEFRVAGQTALVATSETVYVLMLAKTLEKVPIPDAVRKALTDGASGRIADHAGYFNERTG